ncbi:Diphthine methyltransferase [Erysiphe neolycopersici]|uniref:methylated diphthine methylhydrolase n=1 Tax=Erysiphe neolycopersici TaxID=212602 RepID=A0A420HP30_9PEZI|nr:Diphthine methyltransferase [Erysiphe neolycopersici]
MTDCRERLIISYSRNFRTSDNENMDRSSKVTILMTEILELPPSCLEFVPVRLEEGVEYFVVGTYHLHNDETELEIEYENREDASNNAQEPLKQSREGSLILFSLCGRKLTLIDTIPYPSAVLDLHFYNDTLAVASSTGTISIYQLIKNSQSLNLQHVTTHKVAQKDTLVLSLTWYPHDKTLKSCQPSVLFYTLSNGEVLAAYISADFKSFTILNSGAPLIKHDDNAWICTVASNVLFSGGDDSKLNRLHFDIQETHDSGKDQILIERSKKNSDDNHFGQACFKGHNAGVTAIIILPLPSTVKGDTFILTGSYDDHVRVFASSTEPLSRIPGVHKLAELLVGGGVWRLKLIEAYPTKPVTDEKEWEYIVLASCMFVGARILKIKGSYHGSWSIQLGAKMTAHQSMCYSCDVQPQRSSSQKFKEDSWSGKPSKTWTIVSSSFYDRLLVIWEYKP